MSNRRMHNVPQGKKKNPNHVGTITQEDMLKMDRAARRDAAISSGVTRPVGTGVHGGSKRDRNRRERKENRQQTRNWQQERE